VRTKAVRLLLAGVIYLIDPMATVIIVEIEGDKVTT
jgi:hypothetical protein